MIRKAFVMRVHPGREEEYVRRHNPIWPELEAEIRAHGVRNYSIFHDPETNQLYGYLEAESEEQLARMGTTEVARRWAEYMQDVMPGTAGGPESHPLVEVFHLD